MCKSYTKCKFFFETYTKCNLNSCICVIVIVCICTIHTDMLYTSAYTYSSLQVTTKCENCYLNFWLPINHYKLQQYSAERKLEHIKILKGQQYGMILKRRQWGFPKGRLHQPCARPWLFLYQLWFVLHWW